MKIHVVEDEAPLLKAVKLALERAGHSVSTTSHGDSAFNDIQKSQPDVVLMDLLLPGKDGMDIIEELRQAHFDNRIIIITNSNPGDLSSSRLKKLRVEDVFVKASISLEDLLHAIGNPKRHQ